MDHGEYVCRLSLSKREFLCTNSRSAFFFIVNKSETSKYNEKFENDYLKMTTTNPGLRAGRLFKGIREQRFLSEIVFCIAYNSF